MTDFPWIAAMVFLPAAGGTLLLLLRGSREAAVRPFALAVSLAELAIALSLFVRFRTDLPGLQFEEWAPWIPHLGSAWHAGVDGLGLVLVLLSAFLVPVAILASVREVRERTREFHAALLFLEAALVGLFTADDLLLLLAFWTAMLLPAAWLVGVWGGPRRHYASMKFLLCSAASSLPMLLAVLVVWIRAEPSAPDVSALAGALRAADLSTTEQVLLASAFALAFAVPAPLIPFHTWLPDAHAEAPTAGSILLAGVLLKAGAYGFLRFVLPLFPKALVAGATLPGIGEINLLGVLATLSAAGVVYGALMALAQDDLKKTIAYGSVSQMGLVMLGLLSLNQAGIAGGVFLMLSHGLAIAALFLVCGMLQERRGTREIAEFGGIARKAPALAAMFAVTAFAWIGLPGTGGFVGEFAALSGAFRASPGHAVAAVAGVVLGSTCLFGAVRRVFFGKDSTPRGGPFPDASRREIVAWLPVAALLFALGVFPGFFLRPIEPFAAGLLADVRVGLQPEGASARTAPPARISPVEDGSAGEARLAAETGPIRGEKGPASPPAGLAAREWRVAGTAGVLLVLLGSLAAAAYRNVKRILAGAGIAGLGMLLAAFAAQGASLSGEGARIGPDGAEAALFGLLALALPLAGAFGAIRFAARGGPDLGTIEGLTGLARRSPWTAAALSLFLLSLAGLPPAGGFMARVLVFRSALETGLPEMLVLAALAGAASLILLYACLRVILAMVAREPLDSRELAAPAWSVRLALLACAAATLALGVAPGPALRLAGHAARALLAFY